MAASAKTISSTNTSTARTARAHKGWVADGQLEPWSTVFEGFELAPAAFVSLLAGNTLGTTVVQW
jgi:NADPH-dependent curcumin reductase CurA